MSFIESFHRTYKTEAATAANRFVKLGTAKNTVLQNTAATIISVGVTHTAADINNNVKVQIGATAVVEASAAIAKGVRVTSTAIGKAVTAVSGNQSAGIAMEAASADGQLIEIMLTPGETMI